VPRPKKELAGRTKPPGIREIAESLGISIGTVDRALHDRPGINEETRRRILQRAQSVGNKSGPLVNKPPRTAGSPAWRQRCRPGAGREILEKSYRRRPRR
jgi:Bacterial regulatory proteins, lacI family